MSKTSKICYIAYFQHNRLWRENIVIIFLNGLNIYNILILNYNRAANHYISQIQTADGVFI